ncbi:MAG: translocation/assembly module TamB, partial [Novosphingobium sp.]
MNTPTPDAPPGSGVSPGWRVLGWSRGLILAALLFLIAAGGAAVVLDSPLGHRFVADRIAALVPKSGLRIRIGRIDGSLLGVMSLHEMVLSDAEGRFMIVPEASLDWRPLAWLGLDRRRGLDIRSLVLKRGTLLRAPKLNPGDPDAPILPDYDIGIDRLAVENLTVERSVFGQRRRIDLAAKADIRGGRALIDLGGQLGGRDRLRLHLDSEPDRDKFELGLLYNAPRDGLLAALSGVKRDLSARVSGSGRFSAWRGWGVAREGNQQLAAFLLDNRAGQYRLAGQLFPHDLLAGGARQAIGEKLSLVAAGTATRTELKGSLYAGGAAFRSTAQGGVDLANNRADAAKIRAVLTQPALLLGGPSVDGPSVDGAVLDATVDGRFSALTIIHDLQVARIRSGTIVAEGLRTAGTAHWDGKRLRLPLAITAARVVTGNPQVDPRLPGGRISGDLLIDGQSISSERIDVTLKGLAARLVLRGDLKRGGFALAGPVAAKGLALPNLGLADVDAKVLVKFGAGMPWSLQANTAGRLARIDNGTLATLTGGNVRVRAAVILGERLPLVVQRAELSSVKLAMALHAWALPGGGTSLAGQGHHLDYGPFTFEAALAKDGPRASLVLANPLPAASLRDVHVMLSPVGDGFRIETKGDSRLGPFSGLLGLTAPKDAPLRLAIERFTVYQTEVTGTLALAKDGVTGGLAIAGGGVTGTIDLAPRVGGQGLKAALIARGARFGGDRPIAVGNATVDVDGLFAAGNTSLEASVKAEGISSGKLFIGRLAADAALVNGSGSITASLAGRRGTDFALQGTAAFSPDRIIAFVAGNYAGRSISMPRRAVLDKELAENGDGWRLQPTQVDFGRGSVIAGGLLLGARTELKLMLSRMPLSVLDIVLPDLGLGGLASGVVEFR